ncbi:conserved Plasmodium protein, unknown function [Plasmodium knowlesi strain H]|uniref:Uncharacterized protein n=3 Tax=Plasmodium knowlesi TaxID=5850 RepID=A0A1A7VUV7_PLAKH|nr:conserved Plasmodium protein, unknown function [Plasmodium knowlesi strain H]OTN66665.1 Uncharacterized protein PKNOH_S08475200 [Plasmodium knowlesi]CAA9990077.1 conserved Plasmodium protein, unknown function [Plasmodium knowlesi strain H]SBO25742.1 conserved Plasmodium protein, unknown function [Plasmodium knowlesi strain H]SBO28549.1 conserved Plasmodium protein, unknown function [Plasmodium knowlesi strain H]VVS79551.1 conserved Plasmodium protein, unknown function [Plasmodium knowlesi s
MHRDVLEKERLMQRHEKHVKNNVVDNVIADLTCTGQGKTYLRKYEAAFEDYKTREGEKLKSFMKIENRRKENLQRNEERWQLAEVNAQKEKDKTCALQKMPFKSEKNKTKCHHDIINHEYLNYNESIKMEMKKNICVNNRRNYLSHKMSGSYNPITGEKRS